MRYLSLILVLALSVLITNAQDNPTERLLFSYTTDDGEGRISSITRIDGVNDILRSFPNQSIRCFWTSDDGNVLAYGLVNNQVGDISTQPITYYVDDTRTETVLFIYENLQINTCPAWSADGQSFAFFDGNTLKYGIYGQPDLIAVQSFETDVSLSADGTATNNRIHWSPEVTNSTLLALEIFGDIYTLDMELNLQQVTDTPDIVERILSWSDSGAHFAIQSRATLQPEENIYTAIYSTANNRLWRVTDALDGTNITEPIGWQRDSNTYLLKLESESTIYRIDADSEIVQSILISQDSEMTNIILSPDGETLIYAESFRRGENNEAYWVEIVEYNTIMRDSTAETYIDTVSYVAGVASLVALPNRDDVLVTLRRDSDQYSTILFDSENREFTPLYDTQTGAFYDFPTIRTSENGDYITYETQTNVQLFGSESDYFVTLIDVNTGEAIELVAQTFDWDNPYPRPIVHWVSEW